MNFRNILALAGLMFLSNSLYAGLCDSARDCFKQGMAAIENNDISEAADFLERGCSVDDLESCVNLAHILNKGAEDLEKNEEKAFSLYSNACEQNNFNACNELGKILQTGTSVYARDLNKALELYDLSCSNGVMDACNNQAVMLENGQGTLKKPHLAYELYKKACEAENWSACNNLGSMAQSELNYQLSINAFEIACKNKHSAACSNLAYIYKKGSGLKEPNLEKAEDLLRQACEYGDAQSCSDLATINMSF